MPKNGNECAENVFSSNLIGYSIFVAETTNQTKWQTRKVIVVVHGTCSRVHTKSTVLSHFRRTWKCTKSEISSISRWAIVELCFPRILVIKLTSRSSNGWRPVSNLSMRSTSDFPIDKEIHWKFRDFILSIAEILIGPLMLVFGGHMVIVFQPAFDTIQMNEFNAWFI